MSMHRNSDVLRLAFVVPMQGTAGIYGPSCLACGTLAVERLNAGDGIGGRTVELTMVDAGREPRQVAAEVARLVRSGTVHGIAGWHTSAVRTAITRAIGGQVAYAFCAMHEGWDATPGVYMIGERPGNQLLPAMRWLSENVGAKRWAVVGNDYVFPRITARTAQLGLHGTSSRISAEYFLPLGTQDFGTILPAVERDEVDGVLMLLIGHDAIEFNRQFAQRGLDEKLLRLSTVLDENALLGAGAAANKEVYASAAYFDTSEEPVADDFCVNYYRRFGQFAPPLNAIGESCYESIMFLARLGSETGSLDLADVREIPEGKFFESPRGLQRMNGNLVDQDVHIAKADALRFRVLERISTAG